MHKEKPHIEKFAADTILQRGVKLKMPAPFFMRLFGKKTVKFTLTSPFEGTLHRVASYYLSTGLTTEKLTNATIEQALTIMQKHGNALNKALAVALLNGYVKGWLFTKPLAWYLRWHCKPKELFAAVTVLLIYGGVQDFMNTTKSVRKMLLTAPMTGQKSKGS
jgi:hypothetical protein